MWSRTWRVASAGRIWRTTTRCTGKVLFSYLDKHFKACKIFIKIDVDCARSHKNYSPFHLLSSRFPSTSPLKPIPCPAPASAPGSIKKRPSFRDKEGFFKFRSFKKQERETQVSWIGHKVFYLYCVSIELILKVRDIYWRKYFPNQSNGNMSTKKQNTVCGGGSCSLYDFQENEDPALQAEGENQPIGEQQGQRRVMTVEDEQEIWRDITLTQYEHTHWPEKSFTFLCQTFTAWLIILWLDWNAMVFHRACYSFFLNNL